MKSANQNAIQYAHESRPRFIQSLKEFTSIPSISTDPDFIPAINQAAEWVANYLRLLGITNVSIFPTDGHPVVYGELLTAGQQTKTILIYGHYDVQPADPLNLWDNPPFEPIIKGDYIFGRGITDMKGQVMAALFAVESILKTCNLPVNLKFLIEGEEEIGSRNLGKWINNHKELLSCDYALNPDTGTIAPDVPTITYGLRGLAYFELRIFGPDHDLHSGSFGGVVHNPAQVLCDLIAKMHDDNGCVTIPGFYDRVRPLDAEERHELARSPLSEQFYLRVSGAKALWGEAGYLPAERVGARPTLEVNGLLSGYTGEGGKTVLPATAMAKISCRIVPAQDPIELFHQIQNYLAINAPTSIQWTLTQITGSKASISDRNSPGIHALADAMESVWGKRPVYKREGGSVPVVTLFQDFLGVESINTGFALPDDNLHSPNERMHIPTWYKGIDTLINFFFNLAE